MSRENIGWKFWTSVSPRLVQCLNRNSLEIPVAFIFKLLKLWSQNQWVNHSDALQMQMMKILCVSNCVNLQTIIFAWTMQYNSRTVIRGLCKVGMAKHSHSQEDDSIDIHNVSPQWHFTGICQFLLQCFFFLLAQFGALLLVQATEPVVSFPTASWVLLVFFINWKE